LSRVGFLVAKRNTPQIWGGKGFYPKLEIGHCAAVLSHFEIKSRCETLDFRLRDSLIPLAQSNRPVNPVILVLFPPLGQCNTSSGTQVAPRRSNYNYRVSGSIRNHF